MKVSENGSGSSALVLVMESQRRCGMNKDKAIIHYRIAVQAFKKWVKEGIITETEFLNIEALIADKYDLSKGSIYR